MKASELIEQLKTGNPDAIVHIYDPEEERYLPVTGLVFFDAERVELFSDY